MVATAAKKMTKKPAPVEAAPALKPRVVGKVVMRDLKSVKPNPWNPNAMTDFEKASLKNGLLADGWLVSQALLIWGTNEKGKTKDLVIDGEHRWTMATELEMKQGPMVVLDGLTEAQAKALTVKMNAKRGKFQEDKLATLLQSIQHELDVPDFALDLGIAQDDLMKMLATEPELLDAVDAINVPPVIDAPPTTQPMQAGHVVLVQLFFSKEEHVEFLALAKALAERTQAKNVSDTVLKALRTTKEE